MTICALLLGAAVLRPAAVGAAEVRDARPALRQRVDRRHADPLRGAAGADGGAAVELGHAVHARALRLAGGRGDRRVRRRLRPDLPAGAGRARRAARRCADVEVPEEDDARTAAAAGAAAGAGLDHRRPCRVHGLDGLHVALSGAVPRRLPDLPRLRPRHGAVSEPGRAQGAAAGRLLPRRARDPRRPAGVVDRAGPRQPERGRRCSPRRRS